MFSFRFMSSLRMNTRDVIGTGFSFLFVIIVLHVIVGILWFVGFLLFDGFWEEGSWEPSTASWIFGLLFWIPAGIILLCGYIGLWTKLLTDSIAVGVYKANTAGDDADVNVEVKMPWGDDNTQSAPPQKAQPQKQQLSDDGEWKWNGSEWVSVFPNTHPSSNPPS